MKAILIVLMTTLVFTANAQAARLKVAVKPFSGVMQMDPSLKILNIELGLGMAVCSTGWCTVRPNSLQKTIPLEIIEGEDANTFEFQTLRSEKLSKFKAFTTLRQCLVGIRIIAQDAAGEEHQVERVLFGHEDSGVCKSSRTLTPLLQEHLDRHPLKLSLRAGVLFLEN